MKVVVLKTYTSDTEIYYQTMRTVLGYEVIPIQYDHLPHAHHYIVIDHTRDLKPDLIVFIGAVESSHGRPIIQLENLKNLRDIAPTIHMCGDAGDKPWWPILDEYDQAGCFDCQVSIDGSMDSPIDRYRNGIVKLVPVDPTKFVHKKHWHEKKTFVGMTGNHGHGERGAMMDVVKTHPEARWLGYGVDYAALVEFMFDCKIIVNCPMTGSGQSDHVKCRVTETGWATACLLERKNKQTAYWFKPGQDYLEYIDSADLIDKLIWAKNNDDEVHAMARSLRESIVTKHHPAVFWGDVFAKAGIKGVIL